MPFAWTEAHRASTPRNALAVARAAMLGAGLLHLWVVPDHWLHSPVHGVALSALGIAQLAWAGFPERNSFGAREQAGVLLAGSALFLWGFTRLFPAPFGHGPEDVEPVGLFIKAFELLAIVALVFGSPFGAGQASRVRLLAASIVVAFLAYSGGLAVEQTL